jgi:hypothetical protein
MPVNYLVNYKVWPWDITILNIVISGTVQQVNKCAKVEVKTLFEHHLSVHNLACIWLTTFILQPMLSICESWNISLQSHDNLLTGVWGWYFISISCFQILL